MKSLKLRRIGLHLGNPRAEACIFRFQSGKLSGDRLQYLGKLLLRKALLYVLLTIPVEGFEMNKNNPLDDRRIAFRSE